MSEPYLPQLRAKLSEAVLAGIAYLQDHGWNPNYLTEPITLSDRSPTPVCVRIAVQRGVTRLLLGTQTMPHVPTTIIGLLDDMLCDALLWLLAAEIRKSEGKLVPYVSFGPQLAREIELWEKMPGRTREQVIDLLKTLSMTIRGSVDVSAADDRGRDIATDQ